MNHTKNHNHDNQSGCCGGDKPHDHSKPEKEKDGCCDGEAKKPDADKTEKQGGCCGSKE